MWRDVVSEPITAAAIATILVTELAKSSAGEAGKKLVGDLWGAIARRFKGNAAAEETLAAVKAEKLPEARQEAARDLETFLRREMKDAGFAAEVGQLAQQIMNLDQSQRSTTMKQDIRDQGKGYQIQADRIDRIGDDYGK